MFYIAINLLDDALFSNFLNIGEFVSNKKIIEKATVNTFPLCDLK